MLQVTSSVIVELPVLTSDGHIVDCLVAVLSIGVGGIISYISLYIQPAYILTGYSSSPPRVFINANSVVDYDMN